jgi:hypothetical protein
MGFNVALKTVAFYGLLWPVKGYYIGLNFGVFWQTGRYIRSFLFPVESDGFTGVFSRVSQGFSGFTSIMNFYTPGPRLRGV